MAGSNKQAPRLQFTEEERSSPELKKPIQKADRAAKKADKAQGKIPAKKQLKPTLSADPKSGRLTVKLQFEEARKKPPSKLSHATQTAPGDIVRGQLHQATQEGQEDNTGVEAADKVVSAAETSGRMLQEGYRSHQLKPYREAARAEQKLDKANIAALQKKAQVEQLTSNPVSKWQQKQAIKRQYAAAKTGKTGEKAQATAKTASEAVRKGAEASKKAAEYVWKHRKGFAVILGFILILAFFLNAVTSCTMMIQGVGSSISTSTYAAQDSALTGAEDAYRSMETDLQQQLNRYEQTHSYDEYYYDLDTIEHDPYVLLSILSALHPGDWTVAQVTGTLDMLFDKQYILTEDVEVETRYRDSETGLDCDPDDENAEAYDYYICTVTLENFNLSHVPVYIMSTEQLSMYATYMATLGNRRDLYPSSEYINRYDGNYTEYEIPPEALEDEVFAAMIAEAEKYLGYPYVWGGSQPSTSFDCSGFVSWVINHSGWNVGRLGAQGLCNICTPISSSNAKPGDLVFFTGTYDTPGVSHVGLYVGNGMMIHCGDPISYTNLNSNYWQSHLYCYGRLP